MKCVGNCAVCKLEVDKMACCMVQNLRLNIEIKSMLKKLMDEKPYIFSSLNNIESEETDDTGPDVPGTDGVGGNISREQD